MVSARLSTSFEISLRSERGSLMTSPARQKLTVHLDPNDHNGAVFLGLNVLVVKSHGGANSIGIANAIGVAAALVWEDITRRIIQDLDNFKAHMTASQTAEQQQGQASINGLTPIRHR